MSTDQPHSYTKIGVYPTILALFLLWVLWRIQNAFKGQSKPALRSVAIVVLGDIGRSPRMMYHAESFARNNFDTFVVGYGGSTEIPSLRSLPRVRFLYLTEPPKWLSKLPFALLAPLKIIHQIATILATLLVRIAHPPEFILVQNPPSIPTLFLVWLVGKLRGSKVIIDWHNLGYSILALKLGKHHIFVRIAKTFEAVFGRTAYAHLFVTQAMRDHLVREWNLSGFKAVLHDRPPQHFHKASPQEIHELFFTRHPLPAALNDFLPPYKFPYSTPFTEITISNTPSKFASAPGNISSTSSPYSSLKLPNLRSNRPALLVSSTSWTPDEDFSLLLQALALYEKRASDVHQRKGEGGLPKVLVLITGKGPLREKYMRQVESLQNGEDGWKWVRCISIWLEAEDYPLLLGSADLGVCLHSSSSALDLPMKVVDMFGCGLPVCALNFACLHELVRDGENGLVFENAEQLVEQLEALLTSFPNSTALSALRSSLQSLSSARGTSPPLSVSSYHSRLATADDDVSSAGEKEEEPWEWNSWDENWNKIVRPLILRDADGYHREWLD